MSRPRLLVATRSAHKLRELRELLAARPRRARLARRRSGSRATRSRTARRSRRTPRSRPASGCGPAACRRWPTIRASRSTPWAAGPGVRTRRYAGEDATDADNNAKLLAALAGLPPERRGARYVCVLALALPGDAGPRGGLPPQPDPGHLPRPDRDGAARDRRLRLRPDLRAGVGAARRPDARPVDAGREARDLAPGAGRPPDGPAAARARVLSAGRGRSRTLRRSAWPSGPASPWAPWSASGVGHGAGAVPGRGEELRRHRPDRVRSGACESPNGSSCGWTSGELMTTLVTSSRPISSMIAARAGSRSTGTSERIVSPTASSRSGSSNSRLPPRVAWSSQRERICCWRPARVKSLSPTALRDPGVGERVRAVEVVRAGGDREALALEPVAVVGRVVEPLGHVDVDAADRVDHLDEAVEVEAWRSSGSGCRAARRPRPRARAGRPVGKAFGWRSA